MQGLECVEVLSVGCEKLANQLRVQQEQLAPGSVCPPKFPTDKSFSENCLRKSVSYYWRVSLSWEDQTDTAHSYWHSGSYCPLCCWTWNFAQCWAKPEVENDGAPSLRLSDPTEEHITDRRNSSLVIVFRLKLVFGLPGSSSAGVNVSFVMTCNLEGIRNDSSFGIYGLEF